MSPGGLGRTVRRTFCMRFPRLDSGDAEVPRRLLTWTGMVVAINAAHLDRMPSSDYDKLLWGERQIRSVANMTDRLRATF